MERPDLFKPFWSYFLARRMKRILLKRGQEASVNLDYQPNISVLIRTKNDHTGLQKILAHIEHQKKSYSGRIDLIVVDTESIDGTLELAKKSDAAVVKILQKDFSYPKSINLGLAKAKSDCVAAFISVGHAQPALNICLEAGVRHFKDSRVVGVYSGTLPNDNASFWEKMLFGFAIGFGEIVTGRYRQKAHQVAKPHLGIMGATGCMVRLKTWRSHSFDEAYGHGGEDSAWAIWALGQGFKIFHEPAMAVHHTHGLGPINLLRQIKSWMRLYRGRGQFNQQALAKFRPDLFKE